MPITQTPRPSPGKFPRRSLAEIAEDLSRDAEDLSRRRRESLHGSLAENAEMQGWFVSTLLRSLREIFHASHTSSLRLGARCSASPREIRRRGHATDESRGRCGSHRPRDRRPASSLAALSQRSLKISRETQRTSRGDAENLYTDLSQRTQRCRAGLFLLSCALCARSSTLPT